MKKRIISFFTALSMTLMLFMGIPIGVSAAEASETCKHDGWISGWGTLCNPTCTQRGVKFPGYQCEKCLQYFDDDPRDNPDANIITEEDMFSPPLGHDFTVIGRDSTHHWRKCSRKNCNEVDETSRAAHSGGTATCKEKAVCDTCGLEYGGLADHNYGTAWSTSTYSHWHACLTCGVKKDNADHSGGTATCTKKKVCDTCGQEYGNLAAHKYGTDYEKDDEWHWQMCTVCNADSAKTAHTFVWKKNETEHWQECSKCQYKKNFGAHNIVLWEGRQPTCKLVGYTDGLRCSECYYVEKARERIDKTDHTWGEWIVITPATEETEGEQKHTCLVCSTDETEIIPVMGHTFSADWTHDETYHWHAATCGHDVKDEEAEHTWNGGIVTTRPTEETEGVRTYTCTICSATRTESVDKLTHTHAFSADWTSDETYHWHAATCSHDVKDEEAEHTWNGGIVTTRPTEETEGVRTYTCTICSATQTESVDKLVHTHAFSADWTSDETYHWHECGCGEKSETASHATSDWIVEIPATTASEGVQIKKCTVCGIELDRAAIEKLPDTGNTGDVAEDVQDTAGTNAGLVQDNTLIENVLTPEDSVAVENGSSFEIVLEVTDIRDSVSTADVTAASSALKSNEEIGIYVDLSLFKIKDSTERTPIYNTSGQIGIKLTIPESIYASDRMYSIIRVHNGVAENLGGTYDKASRELTFCTDKFSTYAIAFTDLNSGMDKPNVPDTPTKPKPPESDAPDVAVTPVKNNNRTQQTVSPNTGDTAHVAVAFILMLVSAFFAVISGKRLKKNK